MARRIRNILPRNSRDARSQKEVLAAVLTFPGLRDENVRKGVFRPSVHVVAENHAEKPLASQPEIDARSVDSAYTREEGVASVYVPESKQSLYRYQQMPKGANMTHFKTIPAAGATEQRHIGEDQLPEERTSVKFYGRIPKSLLTAERGEPTFYFEDSDFELDD